MNRDQRLDSEIKRMEGKALPGACAPPHKGRGRGPLIFGYLAGACSETNVQKAVGGAGGSEATGVPRECLPFHPRTGAKSGVFAPVDVPGERDLGQKAAKAPQLEALRNLKPFTSG